MGVADLPRHELCFLSAGRSALTGVEYSTEAVMAVVDHMRRQPIIWRSLRDRERYHRDGIDRRGLADVAGLVLPQSVFYDPRRRACYGDALIRPSLAPTTLTQASIAGTGIMRNGTYTMLSWRSFDDVALRVRADVSYQMKRHLESIFDDLARYVLAGASIDRILEEMD